MAALSKLALLPWLQIYQDNIENRRESSDSLMDVYTVTLMASITCWLYKTYVGKVSPFSGFSLGRLHMGDLLPSAGGDKALMGGLIRGGHRPYGGGDPTLIDYIIN